MPLRRLVRRLARDRDPKPDFLLERALGLCTAFPSHNGS
jgi:hypothetical protein